MGGLGGRGAIIGRLNWLGRWLALQVPLALLWTIYETFGWDLGRAGAELGLLVRHWFLNTLMLLAFLGIPPLWWRWRTMTHPKGPGQIGEERDALTTAHLFLFVRPKG